MTSSALAARSPFAANKNVVFLAGSVWLNVWGCIENVWIFQILRRLIFHVNSHGFKASGSVW